jgi:hypothetical protein
MTLRQPADGHGGNAGIDEEASMSHESLSERVALIQGTRSWSSLPDVALAVSVASDSAHRVYVERQGDFYRWSGPRGWRLPDPQDRRSVPACRPRSDLRRIPHPLERDCDHV